MKHGEIIAFGSREKLILSIRGKVWQNVISMNEYTLFVNGKCIVNVRNVKDGKVSVRYISEYPADSNAEPQEPSLEDLYMWLFRDEHANREEC